MAPACRVPPEDGLVGGFVWRSKSILFLQAQTEIKTTLFGRIYHYNLPQEQTYFGLDFRRGLLAHDYIAVFTTNARCFCLSKSAALKLIFNYGEEFGNWAVIIGPLAGRWRCFQFGYFTVFCRSLDPKVRF